jgi:hypothetical protein
MRDEHMRYLKAAGAVAAIGILTTACGGGSDHATVKSTTTKTKPPPPITEAGLKGLLLTPEDVSAVMGAGELKVTRYRTDMSDDSATMEPKECLAVDGAAQKKVYAGIKYTAERDETLQEGDNFTHFVEQAVVLFPSAKQASAFVAASGLQWSACHQYTHTQSHTVWDVGPVSNTHGMLSTTATQENANVGGWGCGRALTSRNNVVIDINTCAADPKNSAVEIASRIAAKVPNQ